MIKNVFLVHHTHVDIGYTHSQLAVFRGHLNIIDRVLDYCTETDSYPEGCRFTWTCETSWTVAHYLEKRPQRAGELIQRVREGRIELTGLYLNVTELYTLEELIRSIHLVKELEHVTGIKIVSAMNSDVPGMAWILPQLLVQAGIPYLSMATNRMRSLSPAVPQPFYWESPDGSRVLTWNAEKELWYALGYELGFAESHERLERSLPAYLRTLEDRGYPYENVCIRAAADNVFPRRMIPDVVQEWNARHPELMVRMATNREFFEAIEHEAGDRLSSFRLAWPDWWADGNASAAYETGLSREAHRKLLAAETLFSMASLMGNTGYPREELREVWNALMFFDEHTWGYTASIREPYSLLTRAQWAVKSSFVYTGAMLAHELLERACQDVVSNISTSRDTIIVCNTLPFERTDVVCLPLPKGYEEGGVQIHDGERSLPCQTDEDGIHFLASGVPSSGYTIYKLAHSDPGKEEEPSPCTFTGDVFENQFYRVSFDHGTGVIVSIYDKELCRELVDQKSPYAFNQYIYERVASEDGRRAIYDHLTDLGPLEDGHGWGTGHRRGAVFHRWSPETCSIRKGKDGPIMASMIVQTGVPSIFSAAHEITLYSDVKRIDLTTTIDKEEILEPEGMYCAFPFDIDKPVIKIGIAGAMMQPELEQLPGSAKDWYSMQECMSLTGDAVGVVLTCREAPLVQLQEINTGKWLETFDVRNGTVFSWLMNNYWFTNFRASQGGRMSFRYSLTSLAPPVSEETAMKFGYASNMPLIAAMVGDTPGKGRCSGNTLSFCHIERGSAMISALMMAEDGEGWTLRLQKLPGESTVKLEFPCFRSLKAWRCTILETVTHELEVVGNTVLLDARDFEIITLRIEGIEFSSSFSQ